MFALSPFLINNLFSSRTSTVQKYSTRIFRSTRNTRTDKYIIPFTTVVQPASACVQYCWIRQCTYFEDGAFVMDVGRAAPTGEGELVLHTFDRADAESLHDALLAYTLSSPSPHFTSLHTLMTHFL